MPRGLRGRRVVRSHVTPRLQSLLRLLLRDFREPLLLLLLLLLFSSSCSSSKHCQYEHAFISLQHLRASNRLLALASNLLLSNPLSVEVQMEMNPPPLTAPLGQFPADLELKNTRNQLHTGDTWQICSYSHSGSGPHQRLVVVTTATRLLRHSEEQ